MAYALGFIVDKEEDGRRLLQPVDKGRLGNGLTPLVIKVLSAFPLDVEWQRGRIVLKQLAVKVDAWIDLVLRWVREVCEASLHLSFTDRAKACRPWNSWFRGHRECARIVGILRSPKTASATRRLCASAVSGCGVIFFPI